MRRKVDEYSNLEDTCQDSYSKTCLKEKKMERNIINNFLLSTKLNSQNFG